MMILRILHIFSGVFVAGYYMFAVPILMPRLKRLGPTIQGPVMQALMPRTNSSYGGQRCGHRRNWRYHDAYRPSG